MENFIFILIGVIWLVYSVIKANQKKNAAPPSAAKTSQDHENRGFEDIIAEILGTKDMLQNPQNQFIETLEEEVVEEEEVGNAYQTLEDLYLKEGLENELELRIEEPIKDNLEPQITERNSRKQQFDLRTAIIYQAIMERPHA
ncbi:MAG: hypothetical protein K8F24_01275 [Bacteroidales bacterium]|nr:hypothetical protein [Bacteroidales bacterium]